MNLRLLNEDGQLPVNITNSVFIKQGKQKEKLLGETGGVIRSGEILKHGSVSKIGEEFDGDRGGLLCQIYLIKLCFWPQAYNSILKVQIAMFSPFGNVQFLFKQKHLLCE